METAEREYTILKHMVTSSRAIERVQRMGISDAYFEHTAEGTDICYTASMFRLINRYYEESGGYCLTERVLDSKILDRSIGDKHKPGFVLLWALMQEQEYDENDLHDLMMQMKARYCMRLWNAMHSDSLAVMADKGLEETMTFIQSRVEEILLHLSEEGTTERQNIDITESGDYLTKEYQTRVDHPELYSGIKIGLPEIDEKTYGFRPPQMIVLLAPSSGGKSVQLLDWATNANLLSNKKILYFSFEMDLWQCYLRHISRLCEVPYTALKSLTITPDSMAGIQNILNSLNKDAYFYYDVCMEDPTPEYVESVIRDLSREKGKPDLIVVDYIGNMRTRNGRRDAKPWEQQGDAFVKLFQIAKRHQLVVLTAQQVNAATIRENRQQKKEKGQTIEYQQDAASGDQRLMHYAHYVIGLVPDKENKVVTYLPVKMRDAWFIPFPAKWNAEFNRIDEMSPNEQEEYRNLKGMSGAKPTDDGGVTYAPADPVVTRTDSAITAAWDGGKATFTPDMLKIDVGGWDDEV